MDRTRYARPGWLDGNSFLYTRLTALPAGGVQKLTGGQIFLHILRTDPAADTRVFASDLDAGLNNTPMFDGGRITSDGGVCCWPPPSGVWGSPTSSRR
jgi:hypothetical protein